MKKLIKFKVSIETEGFAYVENEKELNRVLFTSMNRLKDEGDLILLETDEYPSQADIAIFNEDYLPYGALENITTCLAEMRHARRRYG